MPLSAWNFLLYRKAVLDLESTDALLANVLVLTPLHAVLQEVSLKVSLKFY